MVIWEMLFRTALRTIKNNYGKVCKDFELCKHESCESSYSAWSIADQALQMYDHRGEVEGGQGSAAGDSGGSG